MRKPTAITVLASCAALAGLGAPATAPAATIDSTVSINFVDRPGPDIFRGVVRSPDARCIEDRVIRLFRQQAGPDLFIDRDESEDNGRWDIDVEGDPAPGRYYVRARESTVGADTCAAAISRVIDVAG
jgi:hypothetical protein